MPHRAMRIALSLLAGLVAAPAWAGPDSVRSLTHLRREQPKTANACDSMGPGFTRLEGTDTCVKLGGQIRAEYSYTGR